MSDVCVVVPISFGLDTWIREGQLPGESWNGEEYHFYLWGTPPKIEPGERVYIVFRGALRGYAPLVRIDRFAGQRYGLVRHGGAVAVSIPEFIQGFRGYRYRWWEYEQEQPFPEWQDRSAKLTVPKEVRIIDGQYSGQHGTIVGYSDKGTRDEVVMVQLPELGLTVPMRPGEFTWTSVRDETMLRARNISSVPPLDEVTQAIAKAEEAQQPQERPVFGDPQWIERTRQKPAPGRCIIEVNGKRV